MSGHVHGMDVDCMCHILCVLIKIWVCSQFVYSLNELTNCSKNWFFSDTRKMLVKEWNWTWNMIDSASGKLQFSFVPYDGGKELPRFSIFNLSYCFFFSPALCYQSIHNQHVPNQDFKIKWLDMKLPKIKTQDKSFAYLKKKIHRKGVMFLWLIVVMSCLLFPLLLYKSGFLPG